MDAVESSSSLGPVPAAAGKRASLASSGRVFSNPVASLSNDSTVVSFSMVDGSAAGDGAKRPASRTNSKGTLVSSPGSNGNSPAKRPDRIVAGNLAAIPGPTRSPGSGSRWLKLRNTMTMTSTMNAQTKQKRQLERQDSFIKKFSTQRGGIESAEASDDDVGPERPATKAPKPSRSALVLDPHGTMLMVWMGVVTLAVLYNLWTCIAREAFVEIRTGYEAVWFALDAICDLIYVLDIVVQLRTTYLERGLTVQDRNKLARYYCRSKSFVIDLVSLLPLDLLQFQIGVHPMIRFPRFVKIHRAWHWKIIVENRTVFPNAWRVMNLTHLLFLGCHWFAAFYFLISKAENFTSSWGYPKPIGDYAPVTRKYLKSLYWSTLTLTTIGDLPPPIMNWEYIFTITSYFIGVFVFASIVGQVGNVITNRNATRLEFEKILDNAKNFMRMHNVPKELQRRVMRWYDYAWSRGHANGAGDLNALALLPDKLKTELALHVNLETLKKVTIFQECRPEFLHDLVLKMRPYIFTPGDLICRKGEVAREMFIIADGLLEVISDSGEVLTQMGSGDFFGEIGILNLDGGINRRTADVLSVGYSELFVLSKDDVLTALQDHPDAEALIVQYGRSRLKEIKDRREKRPKHNHVAKPPAMAPYDMLPGISRAVEADRRRSNANEPLKSLLGRLKRSFSRLKEPPPSPPSLPAVRNSLAGRREDGMPASRTCEFFIDDDAEHGAIPRSLTPCSDPQTRPLLRYAEEHVAEEAFSTIELSELHTMPLRLPPSPNEGPRDADSPELCPPPKSTSLQVVSPCCPPRPNTNSPTHLRLSPGIPLTPLSTLMSPLSSSSVSMGMGSLRPSSSNLAVMRQGSARRPARPSGRKKIHSFDGNAWQPAANAPCSSSSSPKERRRRFSLTARMSLPVGRSSQHEGATTILKCVDDMIQSQVKDVEEFYMSRLKLAEETIEMKERIIRDLEAELSFVKEDPSWRSNSAPNVAGGPHVCACGMVQSEHFSSRL